MTEETEKAQRLKAAQELEAIAAKLRALPSKGRILSIVITKVEEAALWYAKLLREES